MDQARLAPEAEARALADRIAAVSARVTDEAAARLAGWSRRFGPDAAGPGAANLAAYLALRAVDLSEFQPRLAGLGLSSLGRCESHVAAALGAVAAALARIDGRAALPFPDPAAFSAGHAAIDGRRDALFGAGTGGRLTRIMATLPAEAAGDGGLVGALVAAGADCVRINCAHDDPATWRAMAGRARAAGAAAGRRVPVSMDLAGPKVRVSGLPAQGVKLHRGDRLRLAAPGATLKAAKGERAAAALSHAELLGHLAPGAPVWFDDGKLRGRVVARADETAVVEIAGVRDKGARLRSGKGVAIPGADLAIPGLTAEDLAALDTVATLADVVAFSFVQTPEDVLGLHDALDHRCGAGPRPAILLKIETALAVRNLPELIAAAAARGPAAVMIARGDLAVSIGFERLAEMQDEILWLCEAAHVPVVWATQVLDDLLHEGLASRAETTDAAMGQRADCVMLNKGPHLPEAVAFLGDILRRMDRHQARKFPRLAPLASWRRAAAPA
jgi:pyruvate kinase